MATIENRSKHIISVKNRDDLYREFPFSRENDAQAYFRELKEQHFKPMHSRLDDAFLVRIREKGQKPFQHTFSSLVEAQAAIGRIEAERKTGLFIDYTSSHNVTFEQLVRRYMKEEGPKKKGWEQVEQYKCKGWLEDLDNGLSKRIAEEKATAAKNGNPPSMLLLPRRRNNPQVGKYQPTVSSHFDLAQGRRTGKESNSLDVSCLIREDGMALSLKVLWSEGLALDAQHFQQLDRYHEARLQHIASVIRPFAWGVQSGRWTVGGAGDNSLHTHELTLIFKDGEIYQAPFPDEVPPPFDLSHLSAEEQSFVFYAALPMAKSRGGNLAAADAGRNGARYALVDTETPDLYTDGLAVNVSYMTKSVRLLSHLDVRDGYDCIPVVKVRRKANDTFEIDPTFMAPSVSISACPALEEMLRGLIGNLTAKCESLYRMQRQPRGHLIEAPGGDASSFWMLNVAMTAGASLLHMARAGHSHPDLLFERLRVLAGGLMAFSRKYTLSDLPTYDHSNPAPGFQALHSIIRDLLDTVISSRYIVIPLTVSEQGMRYQQGRLDSALVEGKASLYVAVSANMSALNLVAEVPRQLKIASPDDIDSLVRSALPGLQLVHMPQVPLEVPVRPDTYYFSLENRGELYEAMLKAQSIAIYAPSTFAELKLELFAITN